jgi:hypothetical protein
MDLQNPRGSTGRGGGITKAAGQNDALGTMPHSALPPPTKVQPILPTKTATETSEPKTMFCRLSYIPRLQSCNGR